MPNVALDILVNVVKTKILLIFISLSSFVFIFVLVLVSSTIIQNVFVIFVIVFVVVDEKNSDRSIGVKKASNSKSNLQGHSRTPVMVHFDRLHIDFLLLFHCNCLYRAPFPIYYHLFSKNLKTSRDPKHIPLGGNHACNSIRQYQSAHKIWNAPIPNTWRPKI